jgi:hypothetical protein
MAVGHTVTMAMAMGVAGAIRLRNTQSYGGLNRMSATEVVATLFEVLQGHPTGCRKQRSSAERGPACVPADWVSREDAVSRSRDFS